MTCCYFLGMRASEFDSKPRKTEENTKLDQENDLLSPCQSTHNCSQLILQRIKIAYSVFTQPQPKPDRDKTPR
jgi:hypothetical protein